MADHLSRGVITVFPRSVNGPCTLFPRKEARTEKNIQGGFSPLFRLKGVEGIFDRFPAG